MMMMWLAGLIQEWRHHFIVKQGFFCYWLPVVYYRVKDADHPAPKFQRIITKKRDENDYS